MLFQPDNLISQIVLINLITFRVNYEVRISENKNDMRSFKSSISADLPIIFLAIFNIFYSSSCKRQPWISQGRASLFFIGTASRYEGNLVLLLFVRGSKDKY